MRLALVAVEIRVLGFHHFLQHVPQADAGPEVTADALRRSRRYARCIGLASRYHCCRTHCLERAATLHLWLRRQGLPSELRIGVLRQGDSLAAHAWVELGGAAVEEQPEALRRFTPLFVERRPAVQPASSLFE